MAASTMLLINLIMAYSGMVTDAVPSECQPGTYLSYPSNTCHVCLAGTYQTQSGQIHCLKCSYGTYQPRNGSTSCLVCAAGTYQNTLGGTECLKCQPGRYQNDTGQPFCKYCALGSDSVSDATSCTPCEIGTYRSHSEQSCVSCESGKTTSKSGSYSYDHCIPACPAGSYYPRKQYVSWQTCVKCQAGSYSNSGATSCTPCAVGTYQGRTGQSSCSPCGDSKTTNGSGADSYDDCIPECQPGTYLSYASKSCHECLAGTYQNQSGQTNCKQCSRGTHQPTTGATSCIICGAGTYQDKWGGTKCVKCQPGQYQDAAGETVCKYCAQGTYSLSGATSCTPCIIGTYRSSSEISCIRCEYGNTTSKSRSDSLYDCIPECQPGTFRSGESGSCLQCSEGTYQFRSVQINCLPCNPGKHQNLTGQTTCYSCPPGTYQPSTGASACLPCPAGTYSKSGAPSCTPCETGTYQDYPMQSSCPPCGAGKTTREPGADSYIDCISGPGADIEVTNSKIGMIAGTVGGVTTLLLVVVIVIIIVRQQMRKAAKKTYERNQRRVQTEEQQYSTIQDIMLECSSRGSDDHRISKCNFLQTYNTLMEVDVKSGKLQLLLRFEDFMSRSRPEPYSGLYNNTSFVSDSSGRSVLDTVYIYPVGERGRLLVITAFPVTSIEFWSCVIGHNVGSIISLGDNQEGGIELDIGANIPFKEMRVEGVSEEIVAGTRFLKIQVRHGNHFRIKHNVFHVILNEQQPEDLKKLATTYVRSVQSNDKNEYQNVLISTKGTNMERVRLLCGIFSVLQHLNETEIFDLEHSLKAARTREIFIVDTYERYKFLHDVAQQYILNSH